MTDKLIVHYIYINKHDKYDTVIPEQVLQLTKLYVNYENLEFKIHNYVSLYEEFKEYNAEFARLISKINPLLPAYIADIGRIFVLWKYGGIYHDAHFYIKNMRFLLKVKDTIHKHGVLFESHPMKHRSYSCRNTNMAAFKNNPLFLKILHKQFENLQRIEQELIHDSSKRHNMWKETTMIFLETLLSESNISNSEFTIKIVPKNEEFCFPWDIQNLPKFYNNPNMDDHWSVLQTKVCAMIV
jgi:DNA-binding Lrp family transcriptional regulator